MTEFLDKIEQLPGVENIGGIVVATTAEVVADILPTLRPPFVPVVESPDDFLRRALGSSCYGDTSRWRLVSMAEVSGPATPDAPDVAL